MLAGTMPPNDQNAERAVLGAVFLNGNALADAMEYVEAGDFYLRQHQILFQAMLDLYEDDKPVDVLTMKSILETKKQLDDAGGIAYLAELAAAVPSARNAGYYAKIVSEKAQLRRLIQTASNIINKAQNPDDEVDNILDEAERQIMDVSEHQNQAGLPTGFNTLDKMTSGLQPDNLIILAARPAVGKTAFALNIAANVAITQNVSVAIFSLEMSAESLVNRMICARGGIRADHLRDGNLDDNEWDRLYEAVEALSKTQIYIDDTPGIKMSEIRAKCRRLAKENKNLGLVVVDYLQLIEGSNKESRQQEVSDISRQLKKLSKELSIPVIALSQLSRGVEQRQDKRPMLSDIRESGSIEQDADIVAFLYRDDYYEHDTDSDDDNAEAKQAEEDHSEVELILEKNRAGARGTVHLMFIKSHNKFTSIAPEAFQGG